MRGSHRSTRRRHYSRREHWLSERPELGTGDLAVRSGHETDPDASEDVGAQLEAPGMAASAWAARAFPVPAAPAADGSPGLSAATTAAT